MKTRPLRAAALASLALAGALNAPPASAAAEPFIGEIMCGGWNFAPRGWAELNGQLLSIAQNTALFSLLGTTYGGNGQTTFALPDMRGRVLMHVGQGPGLTSRTQGEVGGTETNTITTSQMPAHTHTVQPLGSMNDANAMSPAGAVPSNKARTTLYTSPPANTVGMAATTTSATGGSQPVNNVQPFVTVMCVIAVQGIYPSRN